MALTLNFFQFLSVKASLIFIVSVIRPEKTFKAKKVEVAKAGFSLVDILSFLLLPLILRIDNKALSREKFNLFLSFRFSRISFSELPNFAERKVSIFA